MIDADLATYKNLFLQVAGEHLVNIRKNLDLLKTNPQDSHVIYEIFRLFHSLKSQNFFMGFEKTAKLAKTLETYFRGIKDGHRVYNPALLSSILNAINRLEDSLRSIEKSDVELDLNQDVTNFEGSIS